VETAIDFYNKTCSSIAEYQAALSHCLFPSRLWSAKEPSHFEALVRSKHIGVISILKAYASSPIVVKTAADKHVDETSFIFHIQLKGEARYSHSGESLVCRPGTILLTNSKHLLASEQLTRADALVAKFPALFAREYSEYIDRYCWIPKDGDVGSASVLKNFVMNVWDSSSGLSAYDCESLPRIFLNLLDAAYFPESKRQARRFCSPNDELLRRLKTEIIKRLGRPKLSVEELASELCVSRSKLYRATAEAGTPVEKMIKVLRLTGAKKALADRYLSRMSLTDIALEVGFCDQAHFSRSFKKAFGVSPSEYRKQCQNDAVS